MKFTESGRIGMQITARILKILPRAGMLWDCRTLGDEDCFKISAPKFPQRTDAAVSGRRGWVSAISAEGALPGAACTTNV